MIKKQIFYIVFVWLIFFLLPLSAQKKDVFLQTHQSERRAVFKLIFVRWVIEKYGEAKYLIDEMTFAN